MFMVHTNLAHRINAIQNTAEVIARSRKEMGWIETSLRRDA
jgi:hypothetical protein